MNVKGVLNTHDIIVHQYGFNKYISLHIEVKDDNSADELHFIADEVERILEVDPLTGEILGERDSVEIYPAKHFVTSQDKLKSAVQKSPS